MNKSEQMKKDILKREEAHKAERAKLVEKYKKEKEREKVASDKDKAKAKKVKK